MNKFERTYQIDNSREADGPREKHHSIELTDREHLERLGVRFPTEPRLGVKFNSGLGYRPPEETNLTPALKDKKALAEKIAKETNVIDIRNVPLSIPVNIEVPILEKQIQEKGMRSHEKVKSKSPKGKPKKDNSKANAAAVEVIQE